MRLSKEVIDEFKNNCYEELGEEISAFIVEPAGKVNRVRLSMALNLILSEKDVTDYLKSEEKDALPILKSKGKSRNLKGMTI